MRGLWFILVAIPFISNANSRVELSGAYTREDSIALMEAFDKAMTAVDMLNREIEEIASLPSSERETAWNRSAHLGYWLGSHEKMKKAFKIIRRIHKRFQGKVEFKIKKENKGRCKGWISAWTIPYGKSKIRLCEDFFLYRTHLQEKVIVHEMGHEAGLPFHHRIHGCRSARRAAGITRRNLAKRSPENYAWLAMSFLGKSCDF